MNHNRAWGLLVIGVIAALVAPLGGMAQSAASGVPVKVTVTAVGHKGADPASVAKEDVQVRQKNERRSVVSWVPAQGQQAGLDLIILVDDALDSSVGIQLDPLAKFIRSLPPTTRVAVAYARNGNALLQQNLTDDHEAAAKALRITLGNPGAGGSPYLSLIDLLNRIPPGSNRRAVLFISDGIDLFRGVSGSSPGSNFDLQRAIDRAQRVNTQVFTLFASGAGRLRRNSFLVGNGQSSLSRLAAETGGDSFFQGFGTPVSFEPFLDDLKDMLEHQYVLTFTAKPGSKSGHQPLRVTTEVPNVELIAPQRVWVPAE
ncbi:MAG TPA: hypothetical protein VLB32_06785 [Candidatus Acidoferrales bacterium]|nr:hypothetical protein [Candidatus Acidoferrales bacterium]